MIRLFPIRKVWHSVIRLLRFKAVIERRMKGMVKKTAIILGMLAAMTMATGLAWGYTVSKYPAPGKSGVIFDGGTPCLQNPTQLVLRGPVAPSCRPPLVPGLIHGVMGAPFQLLGAVATPLFTARRGRGEECCNVDLGRPAFVTAAVPCTAVNAFGPPRRW
jgi:hypothetical protein